MTYKMVVYALMLTAVPPAVQAAPFVVFNGPLDTSRQKISASFAVNRELGRAWIDVQLQSTDFIGEALPVADVIMSRVDGLSYDPARKQVLFQIGGETIVCAEDATFLWSTSLKSTGQCQLTTSTERRAIDDGFDLREQTVVEVVLEAQPSLQQQAASF